MLGKTFRSPIADGNPLWKVIKKRGANVWLCEVVNEQIEIDGKKYDSDFAGHQDVFAEERITAAIRAEKALQAHFSASDSFYASLKPGQIIHYYNGGQQWMRLRAERHSGKIVVIPIALVGEWREYDLPGRSRTGELREGYHATQIREGKPFHTPASNIYECSKRGTINPASLPAIDLTIPPITPEEAVRIALWQKLKKVEEVLQQHAEQDPNKLLAQIREVVS